MIQVKLQNQDLSRLVHGPNYMLHSYIDEFPCKNGISLYRGTSIDKRVSASPFPCSITSGERLRTMTTKKQKATSVSNMFQPNKSHSYGHLSVISTYNPIYRMYNPIYKQL